MTTFVSALIRFALASVACLGGAVAAWHQWPAATLWAAGLLDVHTILTGVVIVHGVIVADFYPRYALATIRMSFVGQKSNAQSALNNY
jgi:hypothetical protein